MMILMKGVADGDQVVKWYAPCVVANTGSIQCLKTTQNEAFIKTNSIIVFVTVMWCTYEAQALCI
jgi:hypothetical protein